MRQKVDGTLDLQAIKMYRMYSYVRMGYVCPAGISGAGA